MSSDFISATKERKIREQERKNLHSAKENVLNKLDIIYDKYTRMTGYFVLLISPGKVDIRSKSNDKDIDLLLKEISSLVSENLNRRKNPDQNLSGSVLKKNSTADIELLDEDEEEEENAAGVTTTDPCDNEPSSLESFVIPEKQEEYCASATEWVAKKKQRTGYHHSGINKKEEEEEKVQKRKKRERTKVTKRTIFPSKRKDREECNGHSDEDCSESDDSRSVSSSSSMSVSSYSGSTTGSIGSIMDIDEKLTLSPLGAETTTTTTISCIHSSSSPHQREERNEKRSDEEMDKLLFKLFMDNYEKADENSVSTPDSFPRTTTNNNDNIATQKRRVHPVNRIKKGAIS